MATTTVTASKEVRAYSAVTTSWAAARDATSADSFTQFTTSTTTGLTSEVYSTGRGGGLYEVSRGFFLFDVSGVGGTITSMDLKIYGTNYDSIDVMVGKSTAFSDDGNNFQSADFNNWSPSSPTAYMASSLAWAIDTYNTLTLNSTAISDANTNGVLNVVVLGNDYDYSNNEPLSAISRSAGAWFKNVTYPIYLDITYTPPGYGNIVTEVIPDSITNVIGVATANISNIIGV